MRFFLIALVAVICTSAMASSLVPTVPDSSFENGAAGWAWQVYSGAAVSYTFEKTDPHSGKQCIVFNNDSGFANNVYGRLSVNVNVIPSTRYELSCWVRGKDLSDQPGS
jgi:hypothetical protein